MGGNAPCTVALKGAVPGIPAWLAGGPSRRLGNLPPDLPTNPPTPVSPATSCFEKSNVGPLYGRSWQIDCPPLGFGVRVGESILPRFP